MRYTNIVISLLSLLVLGVSCAASPNQIANVSSPDHQYRAEVGTITNSTDKNRYWQIQIIDNSNNTILYTNESDFLGRFNIYWHWDSDQRFWVYNSDDGKVYYWEYVYASNEGNKWIKTEWIKNQNNKISPPSELFPPYAPQSHASN